MDTLYNCSALLQYICLKHFSHALGLDNYALLCENVVKVPCIQYLMKNLQLELKVYYNV